MFLEPYPVGHAGGWIEVIAGSMFSGKTEELIRRLRRAQFAAQRVGVFKPARDTRYHESDIVSHNDNALAATPVASGHDILAHAPRLEVIGIDEAQFFGPEIVDVANQLANSGLRVIVAGLDMDSEGRPFGPMPQLLAVAEFVTKLHAVCVRTGGPAHFSHRKPGLSEEQVMLGGTDVYEPLSRAAFLQVREVEL